MSTQKETLEDLDNLFFSSNFPATQAESFTEEIPYASRDLRLYAALLMATKLACRYAIAPALKPKTKIGKDVKKLQQTVAYEGLQRNRYAQSCWEMESRFLASLSLVASGVAPKKRPAVVVLDEQDTIIGYEKHSGSAATLILEEHPHFSYLPAGVFVDNSSGRSMEKIPSNNPALTIQRAPDIPPDTPVSIVRLSTFIVPSNEQDLWGYDPSTAIENDGYHELISFAQKAKHLNPEGCQEEVRKAIESSL